MIIDHRTYTIAHGRSKEYLSLFEREGLPVQTKHLGGLIGYFQTIHGPLNQIVHLWRYESLADMEQRRAARDADPDWAAYKRLSAGMLTAQENKILRSHEFFTFKVTIGLAILFQSTMEFHS